MTTRVGVLPTFRAFLGDRGGNAAIIFSFSFLSLFLLLVVGVEYTSASAVKRNLQDALDGALLAAAIERIEDDQARYEFVKDYLGENFQQVELLPTLKLDVDSTDDGLLQGRANVTLSGKGMLDSHLFFAGMFDRDSLKVGVYSEVRQQASALNAMLVLDVTGSMQGSKLSTLKKATGNFIDTVFEGEEVKVGITPFARYVNIGLANRNLPGFAIPADYQTCTTNKKGKTTCVNNVWNGCVGSREAPLNAQDSLPTTSIPGVLNVTCNSSTLVRLTDQPSVLKSAVNNFVATGNTYIPSGLMMGWHALTPRNPLPDGAPYGGRDQPLRAIVLMTDGENTASKTSGKADHEGTSRSAADALTKDLCTNIKADGIHLYTVAFEVNDKATRSMLEGCATTKDYAYQADSSAELMEAFEEIVGKLSRLRVSR